MALARSIHGRLGALRLSLAEGDDRTAMAATLFLMFAAGTVLGAVGIPLASYLTPTERLEEAAACTTGLAACVLIFLTWRRLPLWSFQLLLAVGTIVVSVGTLVASVRPTTTEMFYIWVALYAAYFFTRAQAAAQIAFVGISYAVVLALGHSAGNEPARWVITLGTFVGDDRTIELLREYGVDFAQGNHVGRPQPIADLWSSAPQSALRPTST